jgi:hypothetical protein
MSSIVYLGHLIASSEQNEGLGNIFTIETEDKIESTECMDDKTGRQIRKIAIMDEEFGFTSEMKSIAEDPDIIRQEWEEIQTEKDIFNILEISSINRNTDKDSNEIVLDDEDETNSSEGVHTECSEDYIHDEDESRQEDDESEEEDDGESEEGEEGNESGEDDDESGEDDDESGEDDDESGDESGEEEDDSVFYAVLKNVPVQSTIYEDLCGSIDDLIMKGSVSDEEWLAILYQIIFSLAVAQKEYGFIHNDLHTNNVMWSNTTEPYLYYNVNGTLHKVPTYGKIIKIIDPSKLTD